MKKLEICKILEERGIEHDPLALKADLEALLPEDVVKDAPEEESEATEASSEVISSESVPELTPAGEYTVYNKHGMYIRTYSREVHGENYHALAQEFEKKVNQ